MKSKLLTFILLITNIHFLFSQEKKTPDIFNGFRDIEFYKPITDYYNLKYKKIQPYIGGSEDDYCDFDQYVIVLPVSESIFLDSRIKKIILHAYKGKVVKIQLFIDKDVRDILYNLFTDAYPDESESDLFVLGPHIGSLKYSRDGSSIVYTENEKNSYHGKNTLITFKKEYQYHIQYKRDPNDGIWTAINERPEPHIEYTLTLSAVGFKNNIKDDNKKVKEHYDSYLSDFGAKHQQQKDDNKSFYTIPLYRNNNIYYIRVVIGDTNTNMVFDTGANDLIISKNLYKTLKNKNLISDENTTKKMINASGVIVELKKVMIKSLQINDLNVNFIEAYVNTSDDISLLGQSFFNRFGALSVDYNYNVLIIKK